ncbi:DsrE family protein [Thiomicrorhabdus sp. 6S3-12]|uniref:DsrE family protein n=1 Tax=Thiomicrorhabdus sp. 6S3-12 TaxID=2819681 RepID=UPI001AAD77A9|nr:DsrE family protein [Thiomicrorhabdus sp. 6S3-12]MBO1924853.1 DsrE family protein [Thiomicrorhabdus sp. 6S3-12]
MRKPLPIKAHTFAVYRLFIQSSLAFLFTLLSTTAMAAQEEAPLPDTFAEHKVVLQISDADPKKQVLVLNVAANLQRYYGPSNLDIEVVAFGPGVRLMLKDNANAARIKSMINAGVRFSACSNTLQNFAKILGQTPEIIDGVQKVPAGAGRILQLNAAGWQILKP